MGKVGRRKGNSNGGGGLGMVQRLTLRPNGKLKHPATRVGWRRSEPHFFCFLFWDHLVLHMNVPAKISLPSIFFMHQESLNIDQRNTNTSKSKLRRRDAQISKTKGRRGAINTKNKIFGILNPLFSPHICVYPNPGMTDNQLSSARAPLLPSTCSRPLSPSHGDAADSLHWPSDSN